MVSTRHHPRAFPEPDSPTSPSPKSTPARRRTKSSSRPSTPTSAIFPASPKHELNGDVVVAKARTVGRPRSTASVVGQTYTHLIDPVIIVWLFVSLILVAWDSGYIFMRPHSMPGGKFHSPIWAPYALYGTVDYIYGWPAWNDGVGFTAAQGSLNVLETAMYGYYLYILATRGRETGWYRFWDQSFYQQKIVVKGDQVALAVVIAFASAIMTVSKTVLYWLNEYFASFENIGHNSASRLFWLWIVPNGAWLVLPSYMIYVFGKEITRAMHLSGSSGLEKDS